MVSEINTALEEIKLCIEANEDFCLDAGAGSGKTHTLVFTSFIYVSSFSPS